MATSGDQKLAVDKSASAPPIVWLETVSSLFPTLEFLLEYQDPLADTADSGWAQAGKCR